jgi:hypothetical protein
MPRLPRRGIVSDTDRIAAEGHARGIFRQCSIGWHYVTTRPIPGKAPR